MNQAQKKPVDGLTVWSKKPADAWTEAYPIGNGRLGGMVFGWPNEECIQLNEDTLWSGFPRDKTNPKARETLGMVRELVFQGKTKDAEKLIQEGMQGPRTESYQPMGFLYVSLGHSDKVKNYRRQLDLNTATAKTSYEVDGNEVTRELFCSAVDQVLLCKIQSKKPLDISISLDSEHDGTLQVIATKLADILSFRGRVPAHVAPNYEITKGATPIQYEEKKGMCFEMEVHVFETNGTIEVIKDKITVKNATHNVFCLAAATSFAGVDKDPGTNDIDLSMSCFDRFAGLIQKSYDSIKKEHVKEYQSLFNRVSIDLGSNENTALPTDQRIKNIRLSGTRGRLNDPLYKWMAASGAIEIEYDREEESKIQEGFDDPSLVALYFQYVRYLLISCSRPGTQPANLQGIWNDMVRPPWSSNYTMNINIEMNYWPAEVCNLPECVEPLMQFIKELAVEGKNIAQANYGMRGWTCHHNSDLWRTANPVEGDPVYSTWPMGAGWIIRHAWEHYAFGKDKGFLKEMFPLIKDAALFFMDYLVEDRETGKLVTAPSTSPENSFLLDDGTRASVTKASTMDMEIVWDTFTIAVNACTILDVDGEFKDQVKSARERLLPFQISKRNPGCLQEWDQDHGRCVDSC